MVVCVKGCYGCEPVASRQFLDQYVACCDRSIHERSTPIKRRTVKVERNNWQLLMRANAKKSSRGGA